MYVTALSMPDSVSHLVTFTTTTAGVYAYSLYVRYLSHVYHTPNTQVGML